MREDLRYRIAKAGGFTLVELLVSVAVVGLLAAVFGAFYTTALDRAYRAKCVGNMRTILAGVASFTADREGRLWTYEEVGFSRYRMVDDPLGLPMLLDAYIPNKKVWLCPGGRKSLEIFGNNYTWAVSGSFDHENAYSKSTVKTTVVIWDTYNYSLPSMKGASEPMKADGTSTAGPTALAAKFQVRPHNKNTTVNWGFIDGHVINGATAAQ